VFLADLTVELRAWPYGTWARLGVDPQAAASAVIGCWQHGHVTGLWYGGLTAEDALALERPAMALARAWLRDRLTPGSSARRTGRGVQPADTGRTTTSGSSGRSVHGGQQLSGHLAGVSEAADSGRCRGVRFPSHPDTAPRAAVPAEDCGRPPQRLRGIRQSPSQHGVSGRAPRLLVCAVNQDRPARPADTQGPDRRTGGAACGHRGSAGARHRGFPQVRQWSCGHCTSSPLDSWQRNRPPAPHPRPWWPR
jgi:hypothetical protein